MTNYTHKHYDCNYLLKPEDKRNGGLRLDPYFVAMMWKIGGRDNSGCLFHLLKTIARFGDKNPRERELKSMFFTLKRLAELEGVEIDGLTRTKE